jgi:Mn2+/Fe2+ NRAMP family transporter
VHERLRGLRARRVGGAAALFAVLGPGILAGLSDDDPPGITTYSVLGADHGYELLWVLALSTLALIVFHEIAVRTGIVTGQGMVALMRERRGRTATRLVVGALVVANLGTLCAEFAGLAAGAQLLTGAPRGITIPIAGLAVGALVLRGSFHRVEHILLALSAVFVTYIVAGFLAGPDWSATREGLVVPTLPGGRDAMLVIVATVGTTLAPWGLAFIQSYAVDKRLRPKDLRYERVDVVAGAVMTGVIGLFVVIACAATLHAQGVEIDDAADAASALEPLAGKLAGDLFGVGFVGAALLAIAVVPLSTAYSVAEEADRPCDLDLGLRQAPVFYGAYAATMLVAGAIVLVPAVPIVPLLYLSQALNAVLLLAILPFLRGLAADRGVMGEHRLGPAASIASAVVIGLVAASVVTLAVLVLT